MAFNGPKYSGHLNFFVNAFFASLIAAGDPPNGTLSTHHSNGSRSFVRKRRK